MFCVERLRLTILVLAVGTAVAAAQAEEPPRYWALLRDGAQVTGSSLQNGNSWDDNVTLGGRRLFEAGNPVRVLCDRKPVSSPALSCVLLANGDVLPGRVRQFLPASADGDVPGRLLVSLETPLCTRNPAGLAIRADCVLRIVAVQTGTAAREPGTLIFTDGRTMTATAVRWADQGVKALTEAGIVTAPLDEIADLSVPKVDLMAAVSDDRSYPPLDPRSLIARLETADGATLTYCREMSRVALIHPDRKFKPRAPRKGTSEPVDYLHVQPSWALEPILVPVETICRQGFRSRSEVPLSLLPAQLLKQQAALHAWPWCRNRSVRGEVLRSGRITADLGVGTHSYSELAFDLPPGAKEFSTLVGIDASVGDGGCATCKIYQDKVAGKPLFSGEFLRGGAEPVRAGPFALGNAKRLVLVTDFADQNRPAGAFPLDIGDHIDWLLPMLTIDDSSGSRPELLRRFVPGWLAWNLEPGDAERVAVAPSWDDARDRWVPMVRITGGQPVTLTRSLACHPYASDVLELMLAPAEESVAGRISLRVEGKPLAPAAEEYLTERHVKELPRARPGLYRRPQPNGVFLFWDLQEYRGQTIQLALSIAPAKDSETILWHQCALKGAIANLPPDGQPLVPDVPLTSLKPLSTSSLKERLEPTASRLPAPGKWSWPIRFLGQRFESGYGMLRNSSVTFTVDPSYQRFVAVVGSCAHLGGPFQVLLDDKVAWDGGMLDALAQAVQMSVDIPPGTKKLTLRLGEDGHSAACGAWVSAGFVKAEPGESKG